MEPSKTVKGGQKIIFAKDKQIFSLNCLAKKTIKIILFIVMDFCNCLAIAKPHLNNTPTFDSTSTILILNWTKQVGATNGSTSGQAISADNFGNIYITGYTSRGISGQPQNGKYDYFIAEYNATGTLLNTLQVGSSGGSTYGFGINADNFGNVYNR